MTAHAQDVLGRECRKHGSQFGQRFTTFTVCGFKASHRFPLSRA
jgi:hypothetical protein